MEGNSSSGKVRHVTTPTPPIHSSDKTSHSRKSPRAIAMWRKPSVQSHNRAPLVAGFYFDATETAPAAICSMPQRTRTR